MTSPRKAVIELTVYTSYRLFAFDSRVSMAQGGGIRNAFWFEISSPPPADMSTPGSLLSFNVNDGFIEALLRGFKLSLLGQPDYTNLTQCDQLDGA